MSDTCLYGVSVIDGADEEMAATLGDRLREFCAKTNAPGGFLVLAAQADAEHSALLAAEARLAELEAAPDGHLYLTRASDAEARIAAVRELHARMDDGTCGVCNDYWYNGSRPMPFHPKHPCPTIQALTEGGSDD